jgi:hypothetical protein
VVGNLPNGTGTSVNWDGKNNASPSAFVADGIYTVRVSDGTGTEPNGDPIKRQIVVDNTNPTVAVGAISGGTEDVELTITGTASDVPTVAGAGLEKVEVTIRRASDDFVHASGLAQNTGTNFSTWSFSYTPSESGAQKATAKATDNAGNNATSAVQNFTVTAADAQAPTIDCTVPDQNAWHGNNVTVNCTASDAGSGLADEDDAEFSLVTSVPEGTETATAPTDSREVCDNDGNCATAGPYTFKVDRKSPAITCGAADAVWHASDVSIPCTASDAGSGVSPSGDESFSLTTSVAPGTETANAATSSKEVSDLVGNKATAGPIAGNKVDKKAPAISCAAADGAWHASDVSIACTASDGGSGVSPSSDESFSLTTSVAAGTETSNASTNSRAVLDAVGNSATAGPISGNKVDKKGPVVTLTCPASPVILGSTAYANWTASDLGSGVATGYEFGSILLATGSVGSKEATADPATSVDKVSNTSPAATCTYSVIYLWTGFFQPVDNTNLNVAKAGSAIPVKFNLGGYQGLGIFYDSSYPNSSKVNCANINEDLDTIEETVNAGGSSLNYDFTASQYIYVWKSDKSWAGTCRRLDVKLNDGTTHSAWFKWTK